MFFSIVLRKPVWNLYVCNFAHVTSTHAVNQRQCTSAIWMDLTGCSMIHFSRSTNFMRGMTSNCQIREICNQCTCFPTPYNPLFTSLHSRCLPTRLPHVNGFQTRKPNGTMTSEQAVSFLRTVAWHVTVVIELWYKILT